MAVSEGKGKITELELAKSFTDKLQPSAIKEAYESNSDTNAFTDAEKTKLSGIEPGAQVNKVTSVDGKIGDVNLSSSYEPKNSNIQAHISSVSNPHGVTKAQVGLSNVDNVKQMPISGGTFTGIVIGYSNSSYTTKQLRNIFLSTANPSGGSNGDIWIKYQA